MLPIKIHTVGACVLDITSTITLLISQHQRLRLIDQGLPCQLFHMFTSNNSLSKIFAFYLNKPSTTNLAYSNILLLTLIIILIKISQSAVSRMVKGCSHQQKGKTLLSIRRRVTLYSQRARLSVHV